MTALTQRIRVASLRASTAALRQALRWIVQRSSDETRLYLANAGVDVQQVLR